MMTVLLLVSAVALAGCELIAGIFKAGVLVGIVAVALVIAIIVWLLVRVLS
jgi:hypothetical protein